MWFADSEHEKVYARLCEKAQVKEGEREYRSALYVLATLEKPVEQYIVPQEIDFEALIKAAGPWSSGEKSLVKLAASVFNSCIWKASLDNIFYCLDARNCQVALEALKIRYQI